MTRSGGPPPSAERTVHFVLPGDVDDPAAPSGGNTYDNRVCRELPAAGWQVRRHTVRKSRSRAADADAEPARILRELPDGAVVLLDGIIACGAPGALLPRPTGSRSPSSSICRWPTRPGSPPDGRPNWTPWSAAPCTAYGR